MGNSKCFEPTSRKLDKARRDGDVAKSRELTAVCGLICGTLCCHWALGKLPAYLESSLTLATDFSSHNMLVYLAVSFTEAFGIAAVCILPMLLVHAGVVVITETFQVGLCVSAKPLEFRLSRLSPGENLRRLFGVDAPGSGFLWDGLRISVHLSLLIIVSLWALNSFLSLVFLPEYIDAGEYTQLWYFGLKWAVLPVLGVGLLVGATELLIARWQRRKRLMMDAEEFKREIREDEGDPTLKGMRKQLHQEIAFQALVEGVRTAKVLVVNKQRGLSP